MKNPYKKFQNCSIHGSKSVTNDGRSDGRTDVQPRSNMPLKNMATWVGGGGGGVGAYTEILKNHFVRLYWTHLNITLQKCFLGDPWKKILKPS